MQRKDVCLISLGCPKNTVDSEVMLGILNDEGYNIVYNSEDADIIIVNTCAFINDAMEESITTILEQAKHKASKNQLLIATGCLVERYSKELAKEIPELDGLIGTSKYDKIAYVIKDALEGKKNILAGDTSRKVDPLNNRLVSTVRPTAYLKISEGCSNYCTFCIIPYLRGKYRSREMKSILDEARFLAESGYHEIVLIGQDTSLYGKDLNNTSLSDLINEISKIEGIRWIRLLYCYPEKIDDDLINTIAENNKVCNYFDMPIQHINDTLLKRMNRNIDAKRIKELYTKIRNKIPNAILRTSIITGFPGETDEMFNELLCFIEEYPFDRLGVFKYSPQEGTPAKDFENQVDDKIKNDRYHIIMKNQQEVSYIQNTKRVGSSTRVIIEGKYKTDLLYGRSYGEAPEIDGKIYIKTDKQFNAGSFVDVKLTEAYEYDLLGVLK